MKNLHIPRQSPFVAGFLSAAALVFFSLPSTAQIMDVNGATAGFGNYTITPSFVWDSGTTAIWTTSAAGTNATDTWSTSGGGASQTTTFNATTSGGFSTTTNVTVGDSFSVAGITKIGQPTLQLTSNTTRTITLSPGAQINPSTAGAYLTTTVNVTVSGSFEKTGAGILRMQGAYTGNITLSAGTLEFQRVSGGTINNSAGTSINMGAGTTFSVLGNGLGADAFRVGNLYGSGNVTFDGISNQDLVINQSSNQTLSGRISGGNVNGSLTKNGSATLTLTGNNTYVRPTIVSAGTLLINGNQTAATGNVTVSALATLGGNGTIGGNVTIANTGILSPGTSGDTTTTLTLASKNLTISGIDSKIQLNLTGTADGEFAKIAGIAVFAQGGDITFTLSGSYTNGDFWDVFDFSSTSGTFNSITLAGSYIGTLSPSGGIWTNTDIGGQSWKFDESSGTLSVIPEPATWALLTASLTTVMVLRRRRRS